MSVMCPVGAVFEYIIYLIKHFMNPFGRSSKDLLHFDVLKTRRRLCAATRHLCDLRKAAHELRLYRLTSPPTRVHSATSRFAS